MHTCYYCGKKALLGMHKSCWRDLKSFALNDGRSVPDLINEPRILDDFKGGQSYTTTAGKSVVNGRVVPLFHN